MTKTILTFAALGTAALLATSGAVTAQSERFFAIDRNGDGALSYGERARGVGYVGVDGLGGWFVLNDGVHRGRIRHDDDDDGRRGSWRHDDDDDGGYRGRGGDRDDDDD